MNRVIAKEKAIERIKDVLVIANDEGRSMVERVVACDYALGFLFSLDSTENLLDAVRETGMDVNVPTIYGLAMALDLVDMQGDTAEKVIDNKSKAIAAVLFPDLVGGEVDE